MNTKLTPEGKPYGYINAEPLQELWIHTGTACNLACPFCLEGSKPGDTRLQLIKFVDARPFIDEAAALGVKQFSFTGGEPFIAREFPMILAYAAQKSPCLVLTNGTEPLLKRLCQIEPLLRAPYPVNFRISIDYPERARHDSGRGEGNFVTALKGLTTLQNMGFPVSVARQWSTDENHEAVDSDYRQLFRENGIAEDINIVWFPDFYPPGSTVDTPTITEDCMTTYHTPASRADFMCAYSRMIVKINGRIRVYACTLVDDNPDYDLGGTLTESLQQRVWLQHHRCYSCFKLGTSCSETKR